MNHSPSNCSGRQTSVSSPGSPMRTVYLCDDTVDSIFTAIYLAWSAGTSCTDVRVRSASTRSFLEQYAETRTDPALAFKVARSILQKLSNEVYHYTYHACLSEDADKAAYVYRFLRKAFRTGPGIINHLYDEDVQKIFQLNRTVGNEAHHYLEFVRFEELENGVLASRIHPKANIIPLITDHFSDRLFNENWIILDTGRNLAALHSAHGSCVLTSDLTEEQLTAFSGLSEKERQFQSLWKRFFDTIAIEERINPDLQRSLMPLRFRQYMRAERTVRKKNNFNQREQ